MLVRKRTAAIEGLRFNGSNGGEIRTWSNGAVVESPVLEPSPNNPTGQYLQIKTVQGWETCRVGDWVLRGEFCEYTVCKQSSFDDQYEIVEDGPLPPTEREWLSAQIQMLQEVVAELEAAREETDGS